MSERPCCQKIADSDEVIARQRIGRVLICHAAERRLLQNELFNRLNAGYRLIRGCGRSRRGRAIRECRSRGANPKLESLQNSCRLASRRSAGPRRSCGATARGGLCCAVACLFSSTATPSLGRTSATSASAARLCRGLAQGSHRACWLFVVLDGDAP